MKRLSLIFALAILVAGCMGAPMYTPSYGQGYGGTQGYGGNNYPAAPQNIYANPWVGQNTPWTYYQGDWFLNGILHNFFGNQYGWAPYYAYPTTYIVRPTTWYEPRWQTWYQQRPQYWQNFEQKYPYYRGHHAGQTYDQNFYNTHHRGQGEGWNQGFHGVRPPGTAQGVSPRGTAPYQQGVSPRGPASVQQGVSPRGPAPAQQSVSPRGTAPGQQTVSPRGTGPAPGGHAPGATAPAVSKTAKTPPPEKKHQE